LLDADGPGFVALNGSYIRAENRSLIGQWQAVALHK
jgi:hypothetical protein